MGQAEIIVIVPKGSEESATDRLIAAGFIDLWHGERRNLPIDGYATTWGFVKWQRF